MHYSNSTMHYSKLIITMPHYDKLSLNLIFEIVYINNNIKQYLVDVVVLVLLWTGEQFNRLLRYLPFAFKGDWAFFRPPRSS